MAGSAVNGGRRQAGPVRSRARRGVRIEAVDVIARMAPMDVAEAFRDLPGLALLDSGRAGRRSRWSYLVADPIAVLDRPPDRGEVFAPARDELGRLAPGAIGRSGIDVPSETCMPPFTGGLVGFVGYDLGRWLERIPTLARDDLDVPLLRLALHDWAVAWDRREGRAWLVAREVDGDGRRLDRRIDEVRERVRAAAEGRVVRPDGALVANPDGLVFTSSLGRSAYEAAVEEVREAIAAGEIYQANLTRRLEAPFVADPWPLYRRLRTGDPALFAAYLDLGPGRSGSRRAILSASPEPFLSLDRRGVVETDPIKGTRPLGRTPEESRALARELLGSEKDRAENVMIVDVLRNDLGRVCVPGSVRVPRLCRLERTAAVQHLVSTVTGRLAAGRDAFDLLAATFPGGSITGAPKIRAMQIVESLEPVRRGPYTGALCWFGADGAMGSSILIRTFVADGRTLTLGVGGGITYRSDPAAEWEETVAKASGPLGAIGGREAEVGRDDREAAVVRDGREPGARVDGGPRRRADTRPAPLADPRAADGRGRVHRRTH